MNPRKKISIIGIIPQYSLHSQYNIYAQIKMPPIGIVSVLSQVWQDPRFNDVYAIDENNYNGPRDYLGLPDHNFLQVRNPARIAMFYGGMSNAVPRLYSVAQHYQRFGTVTIAGGSHVDALPAEALRSGVDIVVHGEGEETIGELLDVLVTDGEVVLDRDALAAVRGISFLDRNREPVFTGARGPIADLDALHDPDLTLIKFLQKRWSAIPVNRGRGCNYTCEFCVVNKQYGKYKACSVEKAVNQVIKYSDLGYKDFFFTDDNFTQVPAETIRLCRSIGEYKRRFRKKIRITAQVRSEIAEHDELIEALRFAGVKTLAIGYESPIDEELAAMRKGVTVEKLEARSRKLSNYFYLHGMFIFGYPTFQDATHRCDLSLGQRAHAYVRFFRQARIDTIQILNAVPLPGSELRAKLEKEGRLLPPEMTGWDKYDGLFLCYDPTPEGLDPYELQSLPKVMMKKRYLGNFFSRRINYGNWANWAFNATLGFPLQFGIFYIKRFLRNFKEKRRERNLTRGELPPRDLFYVPLVNAWTDIKRKWRNLAVKTYAGSITRKWYKTHQDKDYIKKTSSRFSRRQVPG